ncbi:MAG: ABC transporter substrate-binding protein [Anaerovorax sp.]
MLRYMTIGILPKHLLEGKDITTHEFNQKPVGSGPYKLVSWDMGQSITLEKYEGYYNGTPKIDKVIFKIVEDTDARALQLKSGELDLAQVTPKSARELKDLEGFKTLDMKTADYRGILYNFNHPLFKENRELPNALSYAIDRQAIVDSVLLGEGSIAYSPLQAGPYNNPDIEKYEYNPEKAKELLEAAGWKMGANGYYEKNGKELGFTINNGQGDQVRVDMSNICAQNLQDIGVNAKVKVNGETDWGGQEAYLIGWGSPFDPDDHTYKVFGTDKGANYNGYSNSKVDTLLVQARALQTKEERIPVYQEFQTELAKDLPYTFIAYIDAIYMANDAITGISADKILGHHGVGIFWNIEQWDM